MRCGFFHQAAARARWGALPALALAGFMAFLWQRSADPLAFASVKATWKRKGIGRTPDS